MKKHAKEKLIERADRAIFGLWHNGNYRMQWMCHPMAMPPICHEYLNKKALVMIDKFNIYRKEWEGDCPPAANELFMDLIASNNNRTRANAIVKYGTVRMYGNSTFAPSRFVSEFPDGTWMIDRSKAHNSNVSELTEICIAVEAFNKQVALETLSAFMFMNGAMDEESQKAHPATTDIKATKVA